MSKDISTITVFDLATSGLSPNKHVILEVCALIVDAESLGVIETYNAAIKHSEEVLAEAPAFHKALVTECAASTHTTSKVEGELVAMGAGGSGIVAARALDFRLKFLETHMPTFFRSLRFVLPLELKALEGLALARGGLPPTVEAGKRSYRAVDDAIASYEVLAACGELLGKVGRRAAAA